MISIIEAIEKLRFNYDQNIVKNMWIKLVQIAMDDFKIQFDLENNDPVGNVRDITIPQREWKHTDCKFRCQLWSAGGDWENPVYYFRCQLLDGYAFNLGTYNNSFFIFIPGKKEGNYHLVRTKKEDGWCAPHDGNYTKGIDPERNERDSWKSLNVYLKKLIDLEIEKNNSEQNKGGENG